jgi:hypothetical protein
MRVRSQPGTSVHGCSHSDHSCDRAASKPRTKSPSQCQRRRRPGRVQVKGRDTRPCAPCPLCGARTTSAGDGGVDGLLTADRFRRFQSPPGTRAFGTRTPSSLRAAAIQFSRLSLARARLNDMPPGDPLACQREGDMAYRARHRHTPCPLQTGRVSGLEEKVNEPWKSRDHWNQDSSFHDISHAGEAPWSMLFRGHEPA